MSGERVCVIGLGYIGLPTASVLANRGFQVLGVDVLDDVVETINRGQIHIVEPDLQQLVAAAVEAGQLRAMTNPEPSDVFIIAVPTPFDKDKKPDLTYVKAATKAISSSLKENDLVILESTSPVGSTEMIADILLAERSDLANGNELKVHVAHCPERVLPGKIIQELVGNDRVVGGITPLATQKAAAFYRQFVHGAVIETDSRTAELTKLTENAFRDTNIAFANELSMLCDKLDIDVWELIQLANRHPRVNILRPGPGVGGHCLAVDPWFIVSSAPDEAQLIQRARQINERKPEWVVKQVMQTANRFKSPRIGCLGLAYKPDIDDLRESPALYVFETLQSSLPEAEVFACEPNLSELEGVNLMGLNETIEKADILVALVAHSPFRLVARSKLDGKILFDTCGMFR